MTGPLAIPCRLYRGGTSRGLFFHDLDLPFPRDVRERILLRAFGSPDPRQIDGVGGGSAQTSKAMIVGPADEGEDADVAMLFAEVSVNRPVVDWGGNCGNMSTAVGVFAVETGLVAPREPETLVRIVSRNTGLRVRARIPVRDGVLRAEGEYQIPGVPGTAARIDLEWLDPGGSAGKGVLPTGKPRDEVTLADGTSIEVSIVDAANPVVFCEASSVGLTGKELPAEIEARPEVAAKLEWIRSVAAERIGIAPRELASKRSPGLPKVAVVARPARYRTSRGTDEPVESHDLLARMMAMGTAHRSFSVTTAISTAAAASLPGTIVPRPAADGRVRLGHPYGVMDVGIEMDSSSSPRRILSATVGRTARLLMSGFVHVDDEALRKEAW
jgi:2-methylaconitate cis-trans-isomerase PrpF